jgi:hypothetical protein
MKVVNANLKKFGWAVVKTEGYLSYSVGFTETLDHPEVVMSGIGGDVAQHLINMLGARIRDNQERFDKDGQVIEELLGNGLTCTVKVIFDTAPFGVIRTKYGTQTKVVQIVFPDAQGRYPWQEGFAMKVQKSFWSEGLK